MGSIRYFMKLFVGVERTVCQTGTESVKDAGNSGQPGTVTDTANVSKVSEIIKSDGSNRFLIHVQLLQVDFNWNIFTTIHIDRFQNPDTSANPYAFAQNVSQTQSKTIFTHYYKHRSTFSKERKNWKLNMENY